MFVLPGFSSKALFKPRLPVRGALRHVWAGEFGCRGLLRVLFVSPGPPDPPRTPHLAWVPPEKEPCVLLSIPKLPSASWFA